jgi:N-acetylglucosamine-6-sulfatase
MAAAAASLCLVLAACSAVPPAHAASSGKPDVIFILTDDQRWDSINVMPLTRALLPIEYTNAFVSNPVCCPSRSTILTGLYAHDSGVWTNDPSYHGGWTAFRKWEAAGGVSLGSALHHGGYRTALIGKFLNGWNGTMPRGWDEFAAPAHGPDAVEGPDEPYYNYTLKGVHDGASLVETHAHARADYSTTVLTEKALDVVRTTPAEQPLFLYFAPNAPHGATDGPPIPAPQDKDADVVVSQLGPGLYERDASDKPSYISHRPLVRARQARAWLRQAARSLLAVDRGVSQILAAQALRDPGLQNTVVVFMSDNGFNNGAHRWMPKGVPYEESIRVPMRAWFPGYAPGVVTDMVANLDIAPTVADATGISFPTNGDGRSLLWGQSHQYIVIEGASRSGRAFCGVRTPTAKYIRYASGESEFYDLVHDPYELDSRPELARPSGLRTLAKNQCSPLPPGWPRPTL